MDHVDVAKRLKEARELAAMNQSEVAAALGMPRTAITHIENGNRKISTLELAELARLYRRPVSWFLSKAADADEDIVVSLYRAVPGLDGLPGIREAVDRCIRICREAVSLEKLLNRELRDGPPAYREPVPLTTGEAVVQGERVAGQERKRLQLGSGPIADMAEVLANQGVWASVAALPSTMSGVFLRHRDVGMVALVNASHVRARQRFSLAHEFAHALLDRDRAVSISNVDNSSERIEQRANAFAAAFLLPEAGIEEELRQLGKGQPARTDQLVFDAATGGSIKGQVRPAPRSQAIGFQDVAFIAHKFGVSYQAVVYRLKSLRYLSQVESAHLLSTDLESAGKDYLRALDLFDETEEPVNANRASRELRGRVVHLGLEAYRLGEISRGRLLDIGKAIDIDGRKLLDLAETARTE